MVSISLNSLLPKLHHPNGSSRFYSYLILFQSTSVNRQKPYSELIATLGTEDIPNISSKTTKFKEAIIGKLEKVNPLSVHVASRLLLGMGEVNTTIQVLAPPKLHDDFDFFFKTRSNQEILLVYLLVYQHEVERIIDMLNSFHGIDLTQFTMRQGTWKSCHNQSCVHCPKEHKCFLCTRSYKTRNNLTHHLQRFHDYERDIRFKITKNSDLSKRYFPKKL